MAISIINENLEIRPATLADMSVLLALIKELAEYERLSDQVIATEESLARVLFGEGASAEAVLAIYQGKPVGYALFFHNCSTFLGRRGMYLEDVYVSPSCRGKGIGKSLLMHVAQLAVERGCGRFEWSVLDWNEPAINFYRSLGAAPLDDWTIFRLTGNALEDLARGNENKKCGS